MAHIGNGGSARKGLPISSELAKRLRTGVGMPLSAAGQRVGADKAAVHHWERGTYAPVGVNRERYLRLLHALAGFQLELTGSAEYADARNTLAAELKPRNAA